MLKYLCLLRAVNVGGKNKILMKDLKQLFESLGFSSISTYIQSGNIVFESKQDELNIMQQQIQNAILKRFGFEVELMVHTIFDLKQKLEKNPFKHLIDTSKNQVYIGILSEIPDEKNLQKLMSLEYIPDKIFVYENMIFLYVEDSFSNTGFTGKKIEKTLNRFVTFRNFHVFQSLLNLN